MKRIWAAMTRVQGFILVMLCWAVLLAGASSVRADLVQIQYFDSASNPQFGGPLWTGVVDTTANTLTINAWTELPRHSSPDFWTPAHLDTQPLVWPAVDANGAPFDVPDSFGANGVINFGSDHPSNAANDFAFISPVSAQDMDWHPFEYFDSDNTLGAPDLSIIVNFTSPVVVYPGWGGRAFDTPSGRVYEVQQPNLFDPDTNPNGSTTVFDSTSVLLLPRGVGDAGEATLGTVTVVPEASAFWCCALVAGLAMRRGSLRSLRPAVEACARPRRAN